MSDPAPLSAAIITVCDTCAFSADDKTHEGRSGGEMLAEAVEAAATAHAAVSVRRHSCLMGCARHCNVAISAPGKLSYVLGEFEPTAASAQAIVDYASLYARSETGAVPYKQWPAGVKGHFTARIPPLES